MKLTGLFFGSFNPIHVGHLIIGQHVLDNADLDELWFVVSPHNPLKKKSSLAPDYDRLHLVQIATDSNPKMRASQIEFSLPQPSYTIDTLAYLEEKYSNRRFVLIMGGDNLVTLPKWKNYELLLEKYTILVYKRPHSSKTNLENHPNVTILSDTPSLDISSSLIRSKIKKGQSIQYLVLPVVLEAIEKSRMYK